MKINFKLLSDKATLPTKNNPSDAGLDLYSTEDVSLEPGQKYIFSLGIASHIPKGHFASLRDRSGLASKHAIHTLGGVIDCDYRGEWKIAIVNLGHETYEFKVGDRIAQAVIQQIPDIEIVEVDELETTVRGENGLGSSGR